MNNLKWLKATSFFIFIFLLAVVAFNFYLDTYGVRLSLFTLNHKNNTNDTICAAGMNQHIFNPEYIFRHPRDYDSFIFGSSRTSVIDPDKIHSGIFYNMSYASGLPNEHLAIIKAFLQKGIRIKSVIVGLDEFSFSLSPQERQNQLISIMHPYITGNGLHYIFYQYFFRKPQLFEISNWIESLSGRKRTDKFISFKNGHYRGWLNKEKAINVSGKPIFTSQTGPYSPITYKKNELNAAFDSIDELISLAKKNNFSLIFFINPIHKQLYLNYASGLLSIKEQLATMTDYYDFSGLNTITSNDFYYFEENHYRYLIGNMILQKIYGEGNINLPKDFGILVTRKNVRDHTKKQKLELEQYLADKKIVRK